jgi:hypothetical protein
MATKKIIPVQLVAPKGDDELAVKTRLRILLQLALTIGRREGILGNGYDNSEQQPEQQGRQETEGNGQSQTV